MIFNLGSQTISLQKSLKQTESLMPVFVTSQKTTKQWHVEDAISVCWDGYIADSSSS